MPFPIRKRGGSLICGPGALRPLEPLVGGLTPMLKGEGRYGGNHAQTLEMPACRAARGREEHALALLEPGSERRVIKTQSPVFHKDLMVDLPGEYITYPQRRTAFLVAAEDVRAILYVQSATAEPAHVPPGLLQTVPNLLIAGIISKTDHPDADIPRAERGLARMGLRGPFFTVSAFRPETLEPLRSWLEENDLVPCAGTGKGA